MAVLSPAQRATLTQHLLQRTLSVLLASHAVARMVVVSRDPIIGELATRQGALTLAEAAGAGMNGAIREGMRLAAIGHARHVLVLPADLPLLTAAEVLLVCEDATPQSIIICPDRHEQGTNALLLPMTSSFPLQFGEDSFRKHVAAARYGRYSPRIMRAPGWQFDLDTAEDWAMYSSIQAYQPLC